MNGALYRQLLADLGRLCEADLERLLDLERSAPFEKGGAEAWQSACALYRLALAICLRPIRTAGVARERGLPAIAEELFDATWPAAKRLAERLKALADNGQIERSVLTDLRRCYPDREQGGERWAKI